MFKEYLKGFEGFQRGYRSGFCLCFLSLQLENHWYHHQLGVSVTWCGLGDVQRSFLPMSCGRLWMVSSETFRWSGCFGGLSLETFHGDKGCKAFQMDPLAKAKSLQYTSLIYQPSWR